MKTPEKIKQIAKQVQRGAAGYLDATRGRGLAPEPVIDLRRQICRLCEKNSPCLFSEKKRCCGPMLSILQGGPECGCVIDKKTSLAAESCPIGHWEACPESGD